MFDQLLDSNLRVRNVRSRLFFAIAAAVYAVVLIAIVTTAVLLFNQGLVAAMPLDVRLTAVKLDNAVQRTTQRQATSGRMALATSRTFTVPRPSAIAARRETESLPMVGHSGYMGVINGAAGALPPGVGTGGEGVVPGSNSRVLEPPPQPPVEKPAERKANARVSEGVLQGNAITKEVPRYPEMAKRAGIQGAVQVLITIDESGEVVEASVVNGNPLLRAAALDAARRWRFSPTLLSRVAVRVQGILTFNFQLNR